MNNEWVRHVDDELAGLKRDQAENTRITREVRDGLAQHRDRTVMVIEAIETMQAGVRVLGYLGKFIKWIVPIAAGLATLISIWKGWWKP